MKRFYSRLSLLVLTICLSSFTKVESQQVSNNRLNCAVTYDLGGGRFGDQVIGYLHAKWISYKYDMPLFYKPFIYSDHLMMHLQEKDFDSNYLRFYKRVVRPKYQQSIDYQNGKETLFVIPYFPENLWEHTPREQWYYFPVDWEDEGFKKEIRKMVAPINFTPQLVLPEGKEAVAVHVRLGGGFDSSDAYKAIPLKIPPLSFYSEQIRYLYYLLGEKPLYVHVFTDDKDPKKLVSTFYEQTKDLDVEYGYRAGGNAHDQNVLQDFFEMARFNYMIRPDSNYSLVVSKIGDFKVVIAPLNCVWIDNNTCYIDEVEVFYSKHFEQE